MDFDVSKQEASQYDGSSHSVKNRLYDRSTAYQGYQQQRRKVISSPGNDEEQKIISPTISPVGYQSTSIKSNISKSPFFDKKSSYISYLSSREGESYTKNHQIKSYSPSAPEVSMPGGVVYTIKEENIIEHNYGGYSARSQRNLDNHFKNGKESVQSHVGNQSITKTNSYRNSKDQYDFDNEEIRSFRNNHRQSRKFKNSSNRRRSHKRYNSLSEEDSDLSGSESDFSEYSRKSIKCREKKKQRDMVIDMLMDDYLQRKNKEKEEEELKKVNTNEKTPSLKGPGFERPTNDETIQNKSKIPNYEEYSEIEKEKVREKFRNNYNLLISKYPKWKIEMPDFNLLPLRLIHERYEQVVRTICIYQTAMKWKVYLIIIIAGIEYYGYNIKKYAFLKGLLKAQIKTIHKYDNYLVEFAEMFFSEDVVGDEYPAWLRFLGTFASGLACFSSINGVVKLLGKDASAPDFVFEQADKFVSPPEGTAKLHSDGISDVPEVPSGFQDSKTIIGLIGNLFSTFTGQNTAHKQQTSETPTQPVHAEPIKPKVVDDFENADF